MQHVNRAGSCSWRCCCFPLPVAVLRLWTKQILFAHTLSKSFAIATGYGHAPHPTALHPRGTGKEKLHVCDFHLVRVYLIHPLPLTLFAWQPVCIVVICTPEIPSSGSGCKYELGARARRAAVWRHPSVLKSNSQTVELHVDIFFSVYFFFACHNDFSCRMLLPHVTGRMRNIITWLK